VEKGSAEDEQVTMSCKYEKASHIMQCPIQQSVLGTVVSRIIWMEILQMCRRQGEHGVYQKGMFLGLS